MNIILIIIMVCGSMDTVIVKNPSMKAFYTHDVSNPDIILKVNEIMSKDHTLIVYEEKRGFCA